MDKYMDDYNYHDWSKFMVRAPKDKPQGPHFAAVMFGTRSEWSPGYDDYPLGASSSGSSSTVNEITYFAFPDQETLKQWALRAAKDKKQFFCFEVKKLANVELVVNVDLDFR